MKTGGVRTRVGTLTRIQEKPVNGRHGSSNEEAKEGAHGGLGAEGCGVKKCLIEATGWS